MIPTVTQPLGDPRISAVTGTNGKTSVATATRQLMALVGWRPAGYDSTGVTDVEGRLHPSGIRKSPDYLPDLIGAQVAQGADAFSLEAFVGILADGLLERVQVDVAVCTGLERDHLDVHKSVDAYWAAKLSLFDTYLRHNGVAVAAADCAQGDRVREATRRRGARLVTVYPYGAPAGTAGLGETVRLLDRHVVGTSVHGVLRLGTDCLGADEYPVVLPTVHDVAVTNLLLAATAVVALGAEPAAVAASLERVEPPPGRLQVVARKDGVTGIVDTAHNPGALRVALEAVRSISSGRVILVFGAGGERDRAKRPAMGRLAHDRADLVILTDDNPRREPPARIRREVRQGCPTAIEIPYRSDAIRAAVAMARPGDVVLVAGKGDETEIIVGTSRIPHDDRLVLADAMT